jgi:hypothetical protein
MNVVQYLTSWLMKPIVIIPWSCLAYMLSVPLPTGSVLLP